MAQRPALLQSRLLRTLCPVKTSSRHYVIFPEPEAKSNQPWPHQPTAINFSDDQVVRLASKPLHSLSLADLVR